MRSWIVAAFAALATLALAAPAFAQDTPAALKTTDAMVPANGFSLSTRLYAPAGRETYPLVVLISGSGLNSVIGDDYRQALARAFTARGIGALAYDKRGTGASGGNFTGSDFDALGADASTILRYARSLPQVESVGIWAHSQAGWFAPIALRQTPGVRFAILVSPPGVNPHEQVTHFLHVQALSWGLTPEEAAETERMHRAVALYYAGRASYQSAQAEVDRHRDARWFHGVVTHPYWDDMTPEGRILTPDQLAAALRDRPGAFEIFRAPSSFADYSRSYRSLRRVPTLIVYGGADELLPVARSRAIMERALRGERRYPHEFRVFDGASHEIRDSDENVRADYLDLISRWAAEQFARP